MCTAISYSAAGSHYFGRNLDLWCSYDERVAVTPRNYLFKFRSMPDMPCHYAMIGMAAVSNGYPLYYEATNEKGLSIAGLNFPGNAVYHPYSNGAYNVTPFEFIPWILGQCDNVENAKQLLKHTNLLNENFSEDMPLSPLHWIISDREKSVVAEPLKSGLDISDDPVGVLTNNPPFSYHMHNLVNYMGVSAMPPENRLSKNVELHPYSLGMGSFGLPGDMSSASRFVRAVFTRYNSVIFDTDEERITQFFHILGAVEQPAGCTAVGDGFEYTLYSSCCNTDTGVYYYTTYMNRMITAVDMHKTDIDGNAVVEYPLTVTPQILRQN